MATQVRPLSIQSNGSFALQAHPDNWVNSLALAASTAEYVTVPTGARYVVFGATVDFFVKYNATVVGTGSAVPTDITNGSANECNPTIRYLGDQVAEIGVITNNSSGGIVTLSFFR